MNRVVVTGAAGFVGSALVKECLKNNVEVFAIDILDDPLSRLDLDNSKLTYLKADVFNSIQIRDLLKDKGIDAFYHFAWIGSAGPLREDIECQINNAKMTVELLKVAKEIGCNKFICAGTIMEFESFEAVFSQESKPQMSFIYGIGKQLAHSLCKLTANRIGIDLIWTHITNSFGVGESSPRLINSTIRKCINKEPLRFTSGTQNYDFIYIDDVARAFYLLGNYGKANKSYVIGSGNAGPLRSFLKKLVYTCDKDAVPLFGDVPFTGVNLDLSVFSTHEIERDCGFNTSVSFEEGIKKTFEWLKTEENK